MTIANRDQAAVSAAGASEGVHLRQLIEKQPACLVRVDLQGTLLAVNEAALSMLGATALDQVLRSSIVERFLRGQQDLWREFADRVWTTGSGSVECELHDVSGASRSVLLKGVAHRQHPDGVDSLFLTMRDSSSRVRLERAVQEAVEIRELSLRQLESSLAEQERLAAKLEHAETEVRRLTELVAQAEADRERLDRQFAEERDRLRQTLEAQHRSELQAHGKKAQELFDSLQEQLANAVAAQRRLAASAEAAHDARARDEFEALSAAEARGRERISELETQLARVQDERDRLETLLASEHVVAQTLRQEVERLREEHEYTLATFERERAAHASETGGEIARLHEQLATHERERAALAHESRAQIAHLHDQLATHERDRIAAAEAGRQEIARLHEQLAAQERERATLADASRDERALLHDQLAAYERDRIALVEESRRRIEDLQAQLSAYEHDRDAHVGAARGEIAQLTARLAGLEDEREHLRHELDTARTAVEAVRDDLDRAEDGYRTALAAIHADYQPLIGELERQLNHLREQIQQSARERLSLTESQDLLRHEHEQAIAALRAAHERERQELDHRRHQEHEEALGAVREHHQLALADRDTQLAQAIAELREQMARDQRASEELLAQLRHDLERAHEQQRAAQDDAARTREAERQQVREAAARELAQHEQQWSAQVRTMAAEVESARAEQRRLERMLEETAAVQVRSAGELAAERAHAERALKDAVSRRNEAVKTLTDQSGELDALRQNVRVLAAMAAAGRVAREIGGDLQQLLDAIDARARYLLTLTSLDALHRDELEGLRKDILGALLLVYQVVPDARGGSAPATRGE